MKICTFNVNSIKARKDLVIDWLEHRGSDVDILCFQELKMVEETFPFEALESAGFHSAVFGQKAYNGVAICSKSPLQMVQKGIGDSELDQQSRLIAARIGDLHIINIYAPHGGERSTEKFQYKQDWYKAFLSFLDKNFAPEDKLIVMGDLNVAFTDRDVYDAEVLADTIGTMPEERGLLNSLFEWGLIDSFRALFPTKTQFTWWDYRTAGIWRDEGMRIDYILATDTLIPSIKNLEVDLWPRKRRHPTPSDHAPLLAELVFD
jgi:exodeoxyribonuclease III